MGRDPGGEFPYAAFLWPALAAASAVEAASSMAAQLLDFAPATDDGCTAEEPDGATPGKIALELNSVRLRDFTTTDSGTATLLCTPLALHGAAVADMAPGHSLVEALRSGGIERLFMADWRSASADMRSLGIDEYLAALNVLVDDVGGRVDLVGLCQGGWLSLIYAARFPAKVRKLVMAGAPIDLAAQHCGLSAVAKATPLPVFQGLVSSGNGLVIGRNIAKFWGNPTDTKHIHEILQIAHPIDSPEFTQLEAIFRKWDSWTIDVPGKYYLEVVEKLYKRNELARGDFVALGQRIDLSRLCLPIYLLAGSADNVVAPEQALAVQRLVGTTPEALCHQVAPCNHLSLFMGKRTLEEYWPAIVRWMKEAD